MGTLYSVLTISLFIAHHIRMEIFSELMFEFQKKITDENKMHTDNEY